MDVEKVCWTCLKKGLPLVHENITGLDSLNNLVVCFLCQTIMKKMRAFQTQSVKATQLLREYSNCFHLFKDFDEFCKEKQISNNGFQTLNVSNTICLDITPNLDEPENLITSVTFTKDCNDLKSNHHTEQYYNKSKGKCEKEGKTRHKKRQKRKKNGRDDLNFLEKVTKKELFKKDVAVELLHVKEEVSDMDEEFAFANEDDNNEDRKSSLQLLSTDNTKLNNNKDYSALDNVDVIANNVNEDEGVLKQEVKPKMRKKHSMASELEMSGLLMFENDVSKEEQIQDMKIRKEDKEYINAQHKCELCYFGFKFQHALDTHMIKHSKESGELECWLCHQRFPSKGRLGSHRRSNHSQKMWCGVCSRRFYNKTRLKDHIETHKGFYHKCNICNRTFQSKGSLTRHLSSHEDSSHLKCQYCSRVLKSKESFKSHTLIHLNSRPFACTECPAAFSVRRRLDTHIVRRHRPPSGQHYCVECDFHFKTATDYKTHLSTKKHTDPSLLKHSCSKCQRRYTTEAALSKHMAAMHERVLRYSCPSCPCRYATTQGLNFHRRKVHEGFVQDKKYPCTYCTKAFISKALMESHIRTHTGEQPFQCKQCGRSFTQRSSMNTHMKLVHLKKKKSQEEGDWEGVGQPL